MHPLSDKIATVQRRILWRQRATAALWIVATAIAAAVVLGIADYLIHFRDTGLRIMATTVFAFAVAWSVYRKWYLPERDRLQTLDVARRVESQFPQLQDSLASAIEFLGQEEHDELAGSAQLRRLVVAEAQNTIELLPLEEVIERRPLHRAATALAMAAAAALICIVINANASRIAFTRLVAPFGNTLWPRQNHLEFRHVPTRLAAGQSYEFEVFDSSGPLPDDVRFEFGIAGRGGREVSTEPMTRAGDTLIVRRDNLQQSFEFRAEGGDDDTMPWRRVDVIQPPKLESLLVTIHPPAYTGLPASTAERHLQVLAGTGIEMRATTDKPIKSANILQDGVPAIAAIVSADSNGNERRAFHVNAASWIAAKSGAYRIELVDDEGVAAVVGEWNLRVEPDSPPTVAWHSPAEDMFVLPGAVVPVAVVVKDDLAIKKVVLIYERSDSAPQQGEIKPEPAIVIYRGPPEPVAINQAASHGDTQVATYEWELTPLQLTPGTKLTVHAEAQDYRPGTGKTAAPRRISIITPDELDARLADRQSQIVKQLERALATEQATREDVRGVEIQLRDAGMLAGADRNALQSAELNQRRVGRMLVDEAEGVIPQVESILAEIEINRVENSATREAMERVAAEMTRLAKEPLDAAARELTAARKQVEASTAISAKLSDGLAESLATAASGQDEVIATVERLVGELSGKADIRRYIRLVAELRQDQLTHEKATRAEISLDTLPLAANELTRSQRASLNKAAAGESSLAGRFVKIEQGLELLAQQLARDNDAAAGTVADALALGRALNIAVDLRQAANDLRDNRVGQALGREAQIAENLQKVLIALRNEAERTPEQLADKLRAAEQRLAALREQTAKLREATANAEAKPASMNPAAIAQLAAKQKQTRDEVERLARELDRLQAAEAGKSAQSAAKRLDNRDAKQQSNQAGQKPGTSEQMQLAEQDLKRAAEELAQRRQQAEDDLALEFVRRFQTDLAQMVERQKGVLARTATLHASRKNSALSSDQTGQLDHLATEELQLAGLAKEHSELLTGLEAVRLSLEESERRLHSAARILQDQQTGEAAQAAEKRALDRLEGMLDAFAQTANEAAPDSNASPPGGAPPQNGQQPQRRPTFELLQAKMLRMLQADLNNRTSEFQQQLGAADAVDQASMERKAQELAEEQGLLSDLVEKMIERDNESKREQPK